jgi:hypothetical protein
MRLVGLLDADEQQRRREERMQMASAAEAPRCPADEDRDRQSWTHEWSRRGAGEWSELIEPLRMTAAEISSGASRGSAVQSEPAALSWRP